MDMIEQANKSTLRKFVLLQQAVLRSCKFSTILLFLASVFLIFHIAAKMLESFWLYRFSYAFCFAGSIAVVAFYVLFGYPWLIFQKTSSQMPHEFGLVHRYGGGLKGYLKGTQRLASAFWLINVGSLIVLTALIYPAAYLLLQGHGAKANFIFTSILYMLVLARFFFSSYSIIRCRKNTSHKIFTYLALFYVVIELIHKIFIFPGALASLYRTFLAI